MLTTQLTLREYLNVLRRRKWVIAFVTIATIIIGTLPSLLADPTYASTATLQAISDDGSPFASNDDQQSAQQQARSVLTDAEVLQSSGMRALALERLGPNAQPFGPVTATVVGFSEVIKLRVTAGSAAAAADAANAYADVFVEQRRQQEVKALEGQSDELRRRIGDAQDQLVQLDRQIADPATDPTLVDSLQLQRASLAEQIQDFGSRADQLEVNAALRQGGFKVLSRASLQLKPIAPKPMRSAVIAAVLGLLAGIAIAVMLEIVQDRVSSREDLDNVWPDLTVVGAVPHLGRRRGGQISPAAAEAYRYLRTSILFSASQAGYRSIVVTSAVSGEGKTTTTANLARVVAEAGQRVVLVDADVRRSGVHERFGLSDDVGLTSVLARTVQLPDAIHFVEPNLAILPAGPASQMGSEQLGSPDFASLIDALTHQCDLVIVDAPPVLPVADPIVIGRSVDAALLVARVGTVRRREVRTVLRRLRDASIPVIGLVANDAEPETDDDLYHGIYPTETPGPDKATAPAAGSAS